MGISSRYPSCQTGRVPKATLAITACYLFCESGNPAVTFRTDFRGRHDVTLVSFRC